MSISYRHIKRGMDITLVLALSVLATLLVGISAIANKDESSGLVFIQESSVYGEKAIRYLVRYAYR